MPSYQHQQVSIETELPHTREAARMLRAASHTDLRSELLRVLEPRGGLPAPLIELFNWSENQVSREKAIGDSRDTLYELIRLCVRVNRHCVAVLEHPELPVEPMNESGTADRFEFLADKLQETAVVFGRAR